MTIQPIIDELEQRLQTRDEKPFSVIRELLDMLRIHDADENGQSHTEGHARRSGMYLGVLYDQMLGDERFAKKLTGIDRSEVMIAGHLHDIGKLIVPSEVITSPHKLTDEERILMEGHTEQGADILEAVLQHEGLSATMNEREKSAFRIAQDMADTHHARYDGKGYPPDLAGRRIPIVGRMMAVADVYDALTSERSYRKPESHEEVCKKINEDAGTRFDPQITEIFMKSNEAVKEMKETIARRKQAKIAAAEAAAAGISAAAADSEPDSGKQ